MGSVCRARGDGGDMSYSKMSKRGMGRSKQDQIGQTIYDTARNLLDNRRKLLCPLEIENAYDEVFRYALSEREWAAWKVCRDNVSVRDCIRSQEKVVVKDTRSPNESYRYYIYTANKIPSITVMWDSLPPDVKQILYEWRLKSTSFKAEQKHILDMIRELCNVCTTPGQLQRTWPELLGFMPDRTKNRRFSAKARSPYPPEVLDAFGNLYDKWKPASCVWMNEIFAESLILPPYESELEYPELRDY